MPSQTSSPSKQEKTVSAPPYFYTSRNLPPVKKNPKSPKTIDDFDFAYNDDHELIIVKVGAHSVFDDVQAVKQPTLSELAAKMPGKNPREKLANLAAQGILTQSDDSDAIYKGTITDERGMPNDILEAHQMIEKGRQKLMELDPDMVKSVAAGQDVSTVDKLLAALPADKIKAYYEAKLASKKETASNE